MTLEDLANLARAFTLALAFSAAGGVGSIYFRHPTPKMPKSAGLSYILLCLFVIIVTIGNFGTSFEWDETPVAIAALVAAHVPLLKMVREAS